MGSDRWQDRCREATGKGASAGAHIDEAGWWKLADAPLKPTGLGSEVLDGDLDAQACPVREGVRTTWQSFGDPTVVVVP